MPRPNHLSVVRGAEEEHAAKVAALRTLGSRVPSQMQRVYDWESTAADDLFAAMNWYVAHHEMVVADVEDLLDLPGLREHYMHWLARQT